MVETSPELIGQFRGIPSWEFALYAETVFYCEQLVQSAVEDAWESL